jgi:hypothetical protein
VSAHLHIAEDFEAVRITWEGVDGAACLELHGLPIEMAHPHGSIFLQHSHQQEHESRKG